ncbi:hypothetical protein ARMGADRAFT_362205 [Armillaria gallica]|uniref:Uncharacterized protein n=1 Tax=Armillaria gallica TaxID=47427 RepID=A0A2H3DJY8_ARMGA|nr:hypothetical protein ARMGADRAFT_429094 [Armillaria gallica]PBK88573.1 hypothetical protein ARMGADRAFT_362205 [Armillaria gallica]
MASTLLSSPPLSLAVKMSMRLRPPKPFDGQRTKYRKFRPNVQLRLAAYERFVDDQSKILFILSCMRKGLARTLAENYLSDHSDSYRLTEVGSILTLSTNSTRPLWTRAKLTTFRQGRRPAQGFFVEFDRLRPDTGWGDGYMITL